MAKKRVIARKVNKSQREVRTTVNSFTPTPAAVAEYAAVLAHPFDAPQGVGVPKWPALPTEKVTVKAYTQMTIGLNGNGFACANHSPISSNATNVANVITSNDAATNYTAFSQLSGAGKLLVAHNGALTATDYSNYDCETRVVGGGLRIRYVGKQDTLGGYQILVHSPYDKTLTNITPALVREWESTSSTPVTREWATVVWTPTQIEDFGFQSHSTYPVATHLAGQFATLGIFVSGAEAGNVFEVEYILHYEMCGNLARGASMNAVHEAETLGVSSTVKSQDKGFFSKMLARYGGRALELGHKVASSYYNKNKASFGRRMIGLARKAAPLALTL